MMKLMIEQTHGDVAEQMAGYRQAALSPEALRVLLQAAEVGLEGAGDAGVSDAPTLDEAWAALQRLQGHTI